MIRRWTPSQWAVRLLILVAAQGTLWLTVPFGVTPRWGLVVLVAGLAVFTALAPDTAGGTVLLLVLLTWWGLALRGGLDPIAIAGAVGLLVTHVAITLAAYGPGTMPLDRALLVLWARRCVLVLVPVPLVYLVGVTVDGQPAPPGTWAAGLVAAVLAGVGTSIVHTSWGADDE